MSESNQGESNQAEDLPSLSAAIEEQARIIAALQKRLKTAYTAEDAANFAQATLMATQTWYLMLEVSEGVNRPESPSSTVQVAKSNRTYVIDPVRKKAP